MIVASRNKKTTLNLRLFDEEKDDVVELAERYDVASADLLMFALRKVQSRGIKPQELANFVVSRHNPKLAGFIESHQTNTDSGRIFDKTPAQTISRISDATQAHNHALAEELARIELMVDDLAEYHRQDKLDGILADCLGRIEGKSQEQIDKVFADARLNAKVLAESPGNEKPKPARQNRKRA